MPASEKSTQAFATTSSSCSRPTVANRGAVGLERRVGLELCATAQIEQPADSARVGWLWVDSAAAIPNIRDRHSQADHRTHKRIRGPIFLSDLFFGSLLSDPLSY
jgi:hypothetical protein